MDYNKKILLKEYISNLKVETGNMGFTKVWAEWKEIDYVPAYNKFYLICDGEGWLKIGDREFYPKPGQLYLMPEGIKQSYSSINSNTFTKYWCHFSAKLGDINLFDVIKLPSFIELPSEEVPVRLFKELIKSSESTGLTAGLRAKAVMSELICYYIENSVISEINITLSDNMNRLKTVTDYIEKNLHESITVEKLAQIAHLHPNYFIKFFRRSLGTSPIHYINKMRVEKAKRLVEMTDGTLIDISSQVGVNDIYYFSKLFKEYTGFSPTEYKKMIQGRK